MNPLFFNSLIKYICFSYSVTEAKLQGIEQEMVQKGFGDVHMVQNIMCGAAGEKLKAQKIYIKYK